MLTADDIPSIRFAIRRRLEQETGVEIIQILAEPHPGHIKVGVHLWVGRLLQVKSRFDLPDPFERSHLVNEVDEIAEQVKAARRDWFRHGMPKVSSLGIGVKGTGLRGRWAGYGLKDG